MRRYLFDTNILSALIKQPRGPLAERIINLEREVFCTSIIVACELRYGAVKKGSQTLLSKVEQLLEQIDILPLEPEVDRHYATIRATIEKKGQPIGANDMLIAAHAQALGLTVVTANDREFSRIPDLNVENWSS